MYRILLLALLAGPAMAATDVVVTPSAGVTLLRGTTSLGSHPTLAACHAAAAADVEARRTSATYGCDPLRDRLVITYRAPAPTPVDCVVSAWAETSGPWSACTNGIRTRQITRTRSIVTQPANGGQACPVLGETQAVTEPCTVPPPPPPTGSAAYRFWRFQATQSRAGGDDARFQIADIELRLAGATVPWGAGTATGSGAGSRWNSGVGEGATQAIDNNAGTKALAFFSAAYPQAFSAILTIDAGRAISADTFRIRTANDAEWRDPAAWSFAGSADGVTWTILHAASAASLPMARRTWSQDFSLSGGVVEPPPPPPPPPPPVATGTARLDWVPFNPATNNFRVEYGRGDFATRLPVSGRSYMVRDLAAGQWQFRVIEVVDGQDASSNVVTKEIR